MHGPKPSKRVDGSWAVGERTVWRSKLPELAYFLARRASPLPIDRLSNICTRMGWRVRRGPAMEDHQQQTAPRRYPRLKAPVYFNRLSRLFRWKRRRWSGDPLGGVCIYSDDQPKRGAPLEIEVFLPDGTSVVCRAEVAWVEALPDGAPARCDVGLAFTAIHPHDRQRLSSVLEQA